MRYQSCQENSDAVNHASQEKILIPTSLRESVLITAGHPPSGSISAQKVVARQLPSHYGDELARLTEVKHMALRSFEQDLEVQDYISQAFKEYHPGDALDRMTILSQIRSPGNVPTLANGAWTLPRCPGLNHLSDTQL